MITYYYEMEKSPKGPFKVEAQNDQEAVEKAKMRANLASDKLLIVYEETEAGEMREVWYSE